MTNNKLPPATDWQSRNIDDWNVTTFHAYLTDKHEEIFGCQYVPMRGWQAEKGIIGRLIGTRAKKGTHDKRLIRRFIDEAFATYKPTPQYPGTNFGFIYAYRRNILQRLEAEDRREKADAERIVEETESIEDIADWF